MSQILSTTFCNDRSQQYLVNAPSTVSDTLGSVASTTSSIVRDQLTKNASNHPQMDLQAKYASMICTEGFETAIGHANKISGKQERAGALAVIFDALIENNKKRLNEQRTLKQELRSYIEEGNDYEAAVKALFRINKQVHQDVLKIIFSELIASQKIQAVITAAQMMLSEREMCQNLAGIVVWLAKQGKNEEAEIIASEAAEIAQTMTDMPMQWQVLKVIAVAVAQCKNVELAINIAKKIRGEERGFALANIALILARRGETPQAMEIIETIDPRFDMTRIIVEDSRYTGKGQWYATAGMARILAEQDKTKEAIDMAMTIPDIESACINVHSRKDVLVSIACVLAEKDSIQQAKNVVKGVPAENRGAALVSIAEALARNNDREGAMEIVETITQVSTLEWARQRAIEKIAVALAQKGKIEEAIETCLLLNTSANNRVIRSALKEVFLAVIEHNRVEELVQSNKIGEAIEIIWDMSSDENVETTENIFLALIKNGKTGEAVQAVLAISDEKKKVRIAVSLASALIKNGKTGEAIKSVNTITNNETMRGDAFLMLFYAINNLHFGASIRQAFAFP